jgi:hypothetical protein
MKKLLPLFYLLLLVGFVSCSKDEEKPSLIGSWQGTIVKVTVIPDAAPVPINLGEEALDVLANFKADGSVELTKDAQTTTGTYEVNGKNLIITITFTLNDIDLSGTYTIQEHTQTKLTLYLEKTGSIDHPDFGTVTGTVKATFYFDRVE